MSELSPLSGVKRKLDFGAVRAAFDPLQTTGFRLAATRRPRPRRSSISPNGQNQAVKEAPEQIVAQLSGGAAQAVGLAGPMNASMKKTARRVK
jgi:hypothetical protein